MKKKAWHIKTMRTHTITHEQQTLCITKQTHDLTMQRMAARWDDANQSHQQTGRNHVTKSQGKALMREQDEAAPQQGRPPAVEASSMPSSTAKTNLARPSRNYHSCGRGCSLSLPNSADLRISAPRLRKLKDGNCDNHRAAASTT